MRFQGTSLLAGVWFLAGAVAQAQQAGAPAASGTVIRTETRLVLVDTVVTDKKGAPVTDLTEKNFKVWEDGKEQPITSFSFEDSTTNPNGQPHYMVLFFDNSTLEFADQAKARDAAAKFIDKNVGPNRLIAIVNFGGTTDEILGLAAEIEQAVRNKFGITLQREAVIVPRTLSASS